MELSQRKFLRRIATFPDALDFPRLIIVDLLEKKEVKKKENEVQEDIEKSKAEKEREGSNENTEVKSEENPEVVFDLINILNN